MPILVAFSRHAAAFAWAIEQVTASWGPLALASVPFDFVETDYYRPTMGPDLRLQLFAFALRMDAAELVERKLQTKLWEQSYVRLGIHSEPRPLNLDAGYLTKAKLVLASTKDHAHRLYLGRGVFGEITLVYRDRHWQPHPWTYPNYRREDYQEFLSRAREQLRQLEREGPAA